MSNIAIVFWSATGNTEAMADAVKAGAQEAGAEVSVFTASDFSADMVADFDAAVPQWATRFWRRMNFSRCSTRFYLL